jgi:hypothetical protein
MQTILTPTTYIIMLVALQVADLLTTWYAIRNGGGREANPVLIKLAEFTKLFTNAKWAWLIIAKIVGAALSVYIAYGSEVGSIILSIFYAGIIINNILVIKRL